jgi:hypothetical protein
VYVGRFANYTRRERIAALVSAGTAAARLSWPRRRFEEEMRVVNAAAPPGGAPPNPPPVAEQVLDELLRHSVGYDAPLDLASRWRRSGTPALVARAVAWFQELKERFRYALEVRHELILALLTTDRQAEAVRELRDAQALLRNPNEEVLCRWGRVFKDDGDKVRAADAKAADDRYWLAAAQYEEAYAIRKGHYPGINLATLLLVRAALSRRLVPPQDPQPLLELLDRTVKELLGRRLEWPADYGDHDRRVWHPATQAEALLLQREWEEAERLYRSIAAQPWDLASMGKQAVRIRDAWLALGEGEAAQINRLADLFPGLEPF